MNRLIRTVAVGGTLSVCSLLGWSFAAADAWTDSADETPQRPSKTLPSKRIPALGDSQPRNYRQELFGDGEAGEKSPESRLAKPEQPKAKVSANRSAKKPIAVRSLTTSKSEPAEDR